MQITGYKDEAEFQSLVHDINKQIDSLEMISDLLGKESQEKRQAQLNKAISALKLELKKIGIERME